MFCNVKERMLTVGDLQMRCISFGRGEKPMVMIQGLNTNGIQGSGMMLAWLYRIFAKDHTVYLFDRRENIKGEITVREMASDLAAGMDALGIQSAHVLGVSQGGMIGQYLAIDRPDLVERLVLAVTLSRNNPTVENAVGGWIDMVQRSDMKTFVGDMAEKMYSESYVKQYRPFLPLLAVLQKLKDPARFVELAKSCLSCNTYDDLPKIQCPVLVIGGGKDAVVGAQSAREIAEKLGCELYIYEDLGHAAYEEAKDFNQRVSDFFQK